MIGTIITTAYASNGNGEIKPAKTKAQVVTKMYMPDDYARETESQKVGTHTGDVWYVRNGRAILEDNAF